MCGNWGEGSRHQDADALAGKGFVLGEVGEKLAAVQVEQEKNRTWRSWADLHVVVYQLIRCSGSIQDVGSAVGDHLGRGQEGL